MNFNKPKDYRLCLAIKECEELGYAVDFCEEKHNDWYGRTDKTATITVYKDDRITGLFHQFESPVSLPDDFNDFIRFVRTEKAKKEHKHVSSKLSHVEF